MAFRTYALYGGSRRIVMVLAVLFVVLIPLTAVGALSIARISESSFDMFETLVVISRAR